MGAIVGRIPAEGTVASARLCPRYRPCFPDRPTTCSDAEGDEEAAGKALRKDAGAGKETFLSLLGPERAREQAHFLVDQAVQYLASYGEEADLLRALAWFIVERDR